MKTEKTIKLTASEVFGLMANKLSEFIEVSNKNTTDLFNMFKALGCMITLHLIITIIFILIITGRL